MNKRALIFAFVLIVVLSSTLNPLGITSKAKVSWSQQRVEATLVTGKTTEVVVSFSMNTNIQKVDFWLTPGLHPYVSVNPSSLANVVAGIGYSLTLKISIPTSSSIGLLDGTLHVKKGTSTFAEPLKIRLLIAPLVGNFNEYNDSVNAVFNYGLELKNSIIQLNSYYINQNGSYAQCLSQLETITQNAVFFYLYFSSIYDFEDSQANLGSSFAMQISSISSILDKIFKFVSGSKGLLDTADLARSRAKDFAEDGTRESVQDVAQWALENGILERSDLTGEDGRAFREVAWYLYMQTHDLQKVNYEAAKWGIKQETLAPVSFKGDTPGVLGFVKNLAIKKAIGKFMDLIFFPDGREFKVIGEHGDNEDIELPVGTHDIFYFYDSDTERSAIFNIPIEENKTTEVEFKPGFVGEYMPIQSGGWSRTYGGSYDDEFKIIRQTIDGGYIVADLTHSFGIGGTPYWITKLNSDGDIEWEKAYAAGTGECYLRSIEQTSDGGYIVVGQAFQGTMIESWPWILKLTPQGEIEWSRTYGNRYSVIYSIIEAYGGGYIAVGETWQWGSQLGRGGLVLKLSSTGDIEWQRAYPNIDYAFSTIKQTTDNGYIVAGCKYEPSDLAFVSCILRLSPLGDAEWHHVFYAYGGNYGHSGYICVSSEQTSDGGYIMAGGIPYQRLMEAVDFWVIKLSPNGNIEWQQGYEGGGVNYNSIKQTPGGGYIVSGNYYDGVNSVVFPILVKVSFQGEIDWQTAYGGNNGYDRLFDIQVTRDGELILAGGSRSFGIAGMSDAWVLKLLPDGHLDSSCGFIGSSSVALTNLSITSQDVNIGYTVPYLTAWDESAIVFNTNAIVNTICSGIGLMFY